MDLDDHVCLCFRVSKRKLVNHLRLHRPRVASQLSECGGAGTGCGWCVPILKKLFEQGPDAAAELSPEAHAAGRAEYIREGKGTPPAGSESQ
jgi:NAD(P)H-nitrite reductase large subunit